MWTVLVLLTGFALPFSLGFGNPCKPNPCHNNGLCTVGNPFSETQQGFLVNERGSYKCDCVLGYAGLHCTLNNVCATRSPCFNGLCVAIIPRGPSHQSGDTDYACSCGAEYVGENCKAPNPCFNTNHCMNGGTCVPDAVGDYSCKCPPSHTGTNCQYESPCLDKNPCAHDGICEPQVIHPADNDPEGKVDVKATCRCTTDYGGKFCEKSLLMCRPNPCHNEGTCLETHDGSFKCTCLETYFGRLCQNRCRCENGGTCQLDDRAQKICECSPEYTGRFCQYAKDFGKRSKLGKHKKKPKGTS